MITHTGGGLVELRLVSTLFAVASVPLMVSQARLTDRKVALVATALVVPSWISCSTASTGAYLIFLFRRRCRTALPRDRTTRSAELILGASILACIATHPYGALVLASRSVLLYAQVPRSGACVRVAALLAIPFWRSDTVLASRFDVGVGGGGTKLGSPPDPEVPRAVAGTSRSGGHRRASWCCSSRCRNDDARAAEQKGARSSHVFVIRSSLRRHPRPGAELLTGIAASDLALPFFAACCRAAVVRLARRPPALRWPSHRPRAGDG